MKINSIHPLRRLSESPGRDIAGRVGKIFLLLSMVMLAATPGHAAELEPEPVPTYRLGAGDRVLVTVFGHDDLSGEFEINGANMISMPLISDIEAAGLTVNELEEAIVAALQPDYLKNPIVSVDVVNFRPFYIIGEVVNPGSYPYTDRMTVINAVAVAGGFTYRAKKNKVLIRRGSGEQVAEIAVDMDTVVLPGDVIEVPERFF